MAAITSQNTAQAIVKLIASNAIEPLLSNLVMGNLVNRDYESALQSSGDTINVPIPPVLASNNLAQGGTVQTQNPNLGNAQLVLNSHQECTFNIPDVTKVFASVDLLQTFLKAALIPLGEKIETDLLSLYSLATVNTATGGATAFDEARIDTAETNLFKAKVPKLMSKYVVVSPSAFSSMRQISRFVDYTGVGPTGQPSGVVTGQLPGAVGNADGKIKDMLVYRSQLVPNVTGTFQNLAFAKDGIMMAVRKLPIPLAGTGAVADYAEIGNFGLRVTMSYQPNTLSQQITVDVLYGCALLRNSFVQVVQST